MTKWILRIAAALLCSGLAACGGGGGGGTASSLDAPAVAEEAPPPAPVATQPRHQLFVSDSGHRVIAMFDTLNPAAGATVTTENTLPVPGLVFDGPLAYDSVRDLLYTISNDSNVFVYADASGMDAAAMPARTIALPQPIFGRALYLDEAHDVLYVGGEWGSAGKVFAYANASAASGAVQPTRSLELPQGLGAMAVDAQRGILYTVNLSGGVHVFTDIATASGAVAASNNVMVMGGTFRGLAVDAGRDRVYVTDSAGVHIIDVASTAGARESGVLALGSARAVALDAANDRLYVGTDEAAYIFNQAGSLTGGTTAAGTAIAVPNGTFVRAFAFP